MYKIFINEGSLTLRQNSPETVTQNMIIMPRTDKKTLLSTYRLIEESTEPLHLEVQVPDLNSAWQNFQKNCKKISAGGGVVGNEFGDILVIQRRGMWDLPKGKKEKKEKIYKSAIREVKEETGLKKVKIIKPITSTYHTYRFKDNIILKHTLWFYMATTSKKLKLQEEEDITDAIWITPESFLGSNLVTYDSIRYVLDILVKSKKEN